MPHRRQRHALNAPGDFYVEDDCCTLCGVPGVSAPELFGGFAADGTVDEGVRHCWVKRQPQSGAELDAMIDTMARQELGCIRYGGSDAAIVARVTAVGEAAQVDGAELVPFATEVVRYAVVVPDRPAWPTRALALFASIFRRE
jgi:hypothetical protein